MTAIDDTVTPSAIEGPRLPGQGDALEHWLQDLRTDMAGEAGSDPFSAEAAEPEQPEDSAPAPRPVGRHRRPD